MIEFWKLTGIAAIMWLTIQVLNIIASILWKLIKIALDKKSKREPDHE